MSERTDRSTDIPLSTAALCYAANVGTEASIRAGAHLERIALDFAGRSGSLDASERAELLALRRFRDGIAALRTEIADRGGEAKHGEIVETINAFLAIEGVVEPNPAAPR